MDAAKVIEWSNSILCVSQGIAHRGKNDYQGSNRVVMTQHELAPKGHKGSYLIGYRLGFNALNPPLNYREVFVK